MLNGMLDLLAPQHTIVSIGTADQNMIKTNKFVARKHIFHVTLFKQQIEADGGGEIKQKEKNRQ